MMATKQPVDSSPEVRALQQCSAELVVALSAADPLISWELHAKELIPQDTVAFCQLEVTPFKKSSQIVCALIAAVTASPCIFESLVSVLTASGNTALASVGEKLKQDHENLTQSAIEPIPPCEQTQPLTPGLSHYADYLRAVYTHSEFPIYSKWPPSPSKKYINLAIINKEETTTEEVDGFTRAIQHGQIKEIFTKRSPIKLEEILQTHSEENIKCILVEGAPGVGKSTFAWTICNKWGKGELYRKYSIVLLFQLRDEEIQKATCIADLIFHDDKKLQEQVAHNVLNCHGKDTLILLEGLDELPSHLLTTSSIFGRLISGTVLPQATILVTSRSSATEELLKTWKQQISRHILIIGFTEENINDYVESVVPADKVTKFHEYLSMHPHIKLMLYIPLYCAITTLVYLQCQNSSLPPPKTLTGLYTCLTQTILIRYLQSHPDYKESEHNIESFTNLPPPVFDHFRRLCKMAYDNVEKQQLIFYDLPKSFEHFGFMETVPELFLHRDSAGYSHNFLHLSVQEFLAAYHVSLMSCQEQEKLLRTVSYYDHRFNMVRFLAGITQLKHLNNKLVRDMIGIGDQNWQDQIWQDQTVQKEKNTLYMSGYTLEILYECQDVSILESKYLYHIKIDSTDSIHRLMALGHSIAMSSTKWHVVFSDRQNCDGVEVLCHNIKETPNSAYSIECIDFISCDQNFTHQVLLHLPEYTLKQIKTISAEHIYHGNVLLLPPCLPEVIPRMNTVNTLRLINLLNSSFSELIPALSSAPTLKNIVIMLHEGSRWFTMRVSPEDFPSGTVINSDLTTDDLNQLLPALPQQTIANIQSLELRPDRDSGQLPHCLAELISKMKSLKSLTLETDHDCKTLKSTLSKIPFQRALMTLHITLSSYPFRRRKLICTAVEGIHTCKCNSPDGISLLQHLPRGYIAQIQSLEVSYFSSQIQLLPPCLPELLSRMKKLDTLTLKYVLATSLTELLPVLRSVTTLRKLTLHKLNSEGIAFLCDWLPVCQLQELTLCETGILISREMKITISNQSVDAILCHNCETEFIDWVLPQIPQQSLAQVKSLTLCNEYVDETAEDEEEYIYHHHRHIQLQLQPIPPGLFGLLPRMERLNTLVLKNVSETSLLAALSSVPNLRNLSMRVEKTQIILEMHTPEEDLSIGFITSQNYTQKFLDQFLPALSQQVIVRIKSLTIHYDRCPDVQSLPSSLLELIPEMECLNSLTLVTICDSKLEKLMSLLSTIPVQKLHIATTLDPYDYPFNVENFILSTTETICKCLCENSCRLLKFLPHDHLAQIQSFTAAWHIRSLQEIQEFLSRMKKLRKLTLMYVRYFSLKDLMPVLFTVSTLRDLTLPELNPEGIALLCNWLSTCQLETLTLGSLATYRMTFCNNTIDTIECHYSTKEFINQILLEIPQQFMTNVKKLIIAYSDTHLQSLPPCLPKLISMMEVLNTLTLKNVLDSSLTELRISILPRVSTLKNFAVESELEHFEMLSSSDTAPAVTINSISKSDQLFFEVLQQNVTHGHIESITVVNSQEAHQPLPLCIPKLVPTLERLTTLTLINVTSSSLTKLILALSKVPVITNLTLHELNSEGIVHLYQWLSKYQLETLTLPFLTPDHIEMVSKFHALDTTVSSLSLYNSDFTFQSMQTFSNMLQQKQSPSEVDISGCKIDSDSMNCLVKALHYNKRLRKLDMSDITIEERELTSIADMLKCNTTLEELNLSEADIDSDGTVALAEALHHQNTTLTMLDMSKNPVGERGAIALADMLKHNTTIELNLSGSFSEREIGGKGMLTLMESVRHGPHPRVTISNEELALCTIALGL